MQTRMSRSSERGQNLVEFAFVVPIFAVIIFAIFEFGNVIRTQIELQNAARDGARFAALHYSDGSLQSHALTQVKNAAPDLSSISIDAISYPTACPSSSAEVTVTARYTYQEITPVGPLFAFFHGSFPTTDPLVSTSTLHSEC